MILLRSTLCFSLLVFSTLLFGLIIALTGWVSYVWLCRLAFAWGYTNLKLLAWICGLKYTVIGEGNIPDHPAIYLSKHQSAWETISLRCILPTAQAWVLKRELMWIPIFGWALAVAQPIAINRKAGRKAVNQIVELGRQRLRQGRSVVIFPEGTRVAPGERKRYGIGGAMLAKKSGYPIVPIAHNAGVFWPRRSLKKYPGNIQVVIGPEIETDGRDAKEINQKVEEWIESTVAKLPQEIVRSMRK